MSTTETTNGLGALRGIPPADPGKFLKSTISGPSWDQITADDVSGLSTTLLQSWRFTTSQTTAATSGRLGLNAADWNSATQINVNKTTYSGVDWTNVFTNAGIGDNIVVQDKNDASKLGRYTITAAPIDNGSWIAFPVECDSFTGALPSNNADVRVAFTYYNTSGGGGTGGGGSGARQYVGAYNPATTYNDGDYVIGPDGITYVCVVTGTVGIAPTAWSSGCWIQIPPVVNRQWSKGFGGAAVWAPITPADISGGVNTYGANAKVQYGSNVMQSDSAGLCTIGYPVPFGGPAYGVVGINGDANAAQVTIGTRGNYDTYWVPELRFCVGGGIAASVLCRINWIAFGPP